MTEWRLTLIGLMSNIIVLGVVLETVHWFLEDNQSGPWSNADMKLKCYMPKMCSVPIATKIVNLNSANSVVYSTT